MKRFLLVVLFLFSTCLLFAQLTGSVANDKGESLPYASIIVKGTPKGVIANSEGRYSLQLAPGSYRIVCQYVGYKKVEKEINIGNEKQALNFILPLQELTMSEVVIKRGEDPALEIMRRTIKKREYYSKLVDSFTVDVYIKGLMRSRAIPDRVLGQKIDKKELEKEGLDSTGKGILFLSESVTKVGFKKPNKIKYEVISSRLSGGGFGLSFPFFIDFYSQNVTVFSGNLNPRGFISPISDNAFHYYSYHFEGSFFEGTKMIDRIKVTPRRKNEPLFQGYLQIVDEEWRIHSLDLLTTKDYQLDLIDTLHITQAHTPVTNDIWRVQNQVVSIAAKMFGFDITGSFLNVYSNYNMNPGFGRKFFDRVLMKYDTAFNKKDSIYWNNIRPVALEPDEKQNYQFRDSANKAERDSMYSQKNIDSLRKGRKKMHLKDFVLTGARTQFYSQKLFTNYKFESLIKNTNFNTVEGLNITADQNIDFMPRKGKNNYSIGWNTRYGFSNGHLNSYLTFTVKPKTDYFRNRYFLLSGGKRVAQLNPQNPIDELTNTFFTLLYKRNYMKVYENWFGRMEYNNRFDNGVKWNISATYERRQPLQNTTNYSFFKDEELYSPNNPPELGRWGFFPYNALTAAVNFSFQPGQQYIEFPWRRIAVGSKYPTFEINYSKGIPGVISTITDFDKWKFSIYDDANFKMLGTFRYRIAIGGFLNNKMVGIPDMVHFNGNQTFYNDKYLNSFQLAPYYRYSNTEKLYALGHAEHHFNGLVTNKIPLLNKLKWNLVAGSNVFYVKQDKYYMEVFGGLENIFKLLRVDFVIATQPYYPQSYGIRIGMGGILGANFARNR